MVIAIESAELQGYVCVCSPLASSNSNLKQDEYLEETACD
jgi:hypothetical protein